MKKFINTLVSLAIVGSLTPANIITSAVIAAETDTKIISCYAIDKNTLMDKQSGFWYEVPEVIPGELYRTAVFDYTGSPADYEVFDFDLYPDYFSGVINGSYNIDISRFELCTAIDNNTVIQADGNIFAITGGTMKKDHLYYVVFDKNDTDDITDDIITEILPAGVFDIEIYECYKMENQ